MNQSVLNFDAPCQRHSATSREAAASIEPAIHTLRRKVLDAIRAHGGLTDEQGIELTGMSPSTYRPRRIELVESRLVEDSGLTRKTKSGRWAAVWRAT